MSFLDGILGNRDEAPRPQPKRAPFYLGDIEPQAQMEILSPGDLKAAFDRQQVNKLGRPQYPDVDPGSLLKAYQRNEMVYAAIDIKASGAMDPRLIVEMKGAKSEWQEEGGHPLRRLMMKPNNYMDEAGFLRAWIVCRDTVGRFVAEIVRGANRLPMELHPLNPTKVNPVPRSDGKTDWLFKDGNEKVLLPYEDVLVHQLWNPASRWTPLAPLSVAMGSVDADSAQTDYVRAFFNNGGVPSGILKFKDRRLTQQQADEAAARWRAKYNRAWGRQHDIGVLDEGADYQRIGANLNELESEALRSFTESRIAMVFKVPPLIIYSYTGLLRATYSNLKEAWQGFGDYTLSPLLKEYRNWLMKSLLLEFVSEDLVLGERVRLSWDMSQVAWTQEDVTEMQNRTRSNFAAGLITLNEARARIGEEPDKAGDYYMRSVALVPVSKDVAPDELIALPAPAKSRQVKAGPTPTEVKATRAALEKKMQLKLQRYLMKDFARVAERVGKAA